MSTSKNDLSFSKTIWNQLSLSKNTEMSSWLTVAVVMLDNRRVHITATQKFLKSFLRYIGLNIETSIEY